MKILAVDTTRKAARIFLVDGKLNKVHTLKDDEKQSEFLMLNIDKFLTENSLGLSDIDVYGVITGPGSFTGIRVGIATVKAFSYALNKNVVNATVFDVVKDYVKNGVFLSECTSTSCYFADIQNGEIVETGVIDKNAIPKLSGEIFVLEEEHIFDDEAYKLNVLKNYSDLCCSKFLQLAKRKDFSNPEPVYVQVSQAERNLEKKND